MLPLRAIKIVVAVWQIISRVYEPCRPHTIATGGRVRINRLVVCLAFSFRNTHIHHVVVGIAYVGIPV